MSHVTTVTVEVRDLDALAAACRRCGLELVRGQTSYRWYGHHVGDYPLPAGFAESELGTCQHAIRVAGSSTAYEIGVTARRDGRPGYALIWDFFGRAGSELQQHAGPECTKLRQAYSVELATRQARRQGFTVTEQRQPDGTIRLVARK